MSTEAALPESFDADDILYEEELLRNPYSLKLWLRYLEAKHLAKPSARNMMFERALHALPGSYKLWLMYLRERKNRAVKACIDDPSVEALNNTFERSLIWMHKMPRIWLEYLSFLMHQKSITRTRHTFDRALRSLPATQHDKIWTLYLTFAHDCGVEETTIRIFRRYVKIYQDGTEEFISILKKMNRWDEAATLLANALNRDNFISKYGKSKHEMWMDLCEILTKHARDIKSVKVEPVIRSAIRRFSDETGRLWVALADYYIRLGHFDKARDIFEEATSTVMTVRDFSVVFDAQTTFEESMIQARLEMLQSDEENNAEKKENNEEEKEDNELDPEAHDLDLRMARLEYLIERRPEMLSSVLLRQNPNNVAEWHRRVKIFENDPEKVILTYAEAVKTVDPKTTTGKCSSLWIAFAKYYEENDDLENARVIFEQATKVEFRSVDDLAGVWCEWIEAELRHDMYEDALALCKRAVAGAPRALLRGDADAWKKQNTPPQQRLWQSTRIWALYTDLSENLRPLDDTKAVYERMIELKVCSPQTILNYAHLLEENKFFEESFRVYEKGVGLFPFPAVSPLWTTYLQKFLGRYKGTKVERARDLFEQVLAKIPQDLCTPFYLMYAKFEEDFGLVKRAMTVYDRAVKAVKQEDRLGLFQHYVARVAEYFGVTKTRPIYEQAMQALPDEQVKDIAIQFIAVEQRLGEIDRVRAIFLYASKYCDPKVQIAFWNAWQEFEVKHGNEETFRDMLRVKRSVQLEYTQHRMMTADVSGVLGDERDTKKGKFESEMERLERESGQKALPPPPQFAQKAAPPPKPVETVSHPPPLPVESNPEEIDLFASEEQGGGGGGEDEENEENEENGKRSRATFENNNNIKRKNDAMDEGEEGEEGEEGGGKLDLEELPVPDAVFGGFKAGNAEGGGAAAMGARDRFRNRGK